MIGLRGVVFATTICLGVALVGPAPAFAQGSLSVTPDSALLDGETVALEGTGFNPGVYVGICEAINDGSPGQDDCGAQIPVTLTSASGAFSGAYVVHRFIQPPSVGRVVDCLIESCFMGAAEESDIAGTATFTAITFAPQVPDGRIKLTGSGTIIGDNIYNDNGTGQTSRHVIAPGGKWGFALQVENDGLNTDDITVTAPAVASPFSVRYFFGYYDVTPFVTGAGLTYHGVASGAIRALAVQFTANPGAPGGARTDVLVKFTSVSGGTSDTVKVGVVVPTAT